MKIMNTESPFYSYYSGKNLEAWQIWAWMESNGNSDTSLLGVETTTVILEKHLAQPCKVEQIHTPQVSNSPLGYTPENLLCRCIKRHTNVLRSFVQKNRWTKQPETTQTKGRNNSYPQRGWIRKLWFIHLMKYHTLAKRMNHRSTHLCIETILGKTIKAQKNSNLTRAFL